MRAAIRLGAVAIGLLCVALPVGAQVPDSVPPATPAGAPEAANPPAPLVPLQQPPDTAAERDVSTAGAMLRGILIPGWGHMVSGARTRGGFYFMVQSANGWMLTKTLRSLSAAQRARDLYEDELSARLQLDGPLAPDSLEILLAADERVEDARGLVAARKNQREDWVALTLFFTLLGGVDAFVSAHLGNFPEPLEFEATDDGRVEVGYRIPLGGPPGRPVPLRSGPTGAGANRAWTAGSAALRSATPPGEADRPRR